MTVPALANQADLDRLRRDQSGVCWWCSSIADSREHRHKASILRQMWGDEGLYLGRSGEDLRALKSPRSDLVKFKKVLCRKCNNVRSQPFDHAYDVYAKYVQANSVRLTRGKKIDWREVYGADWQEPACNLGRYAIKNFGCWMAESGFAPPRAFSTFLNGGELLDTRLMLVRQQSASLAYRAILLDGEPPVDRGIGVLEGIGWLDTDRTRLIGYENYSYISDICMRINWADASGAGELFWTSPSTPLATMPASIRQRVLAVQIGVRALARRAQRATRAGSASQGRPRNS